MRPAGRLSSRQGETHVAPGPAVSGWGRSERGGGARPPPPHRRRSWPDADVVCVKCAVRRTSRRVCPWEAGQPPAGQSPWPSPVEAPGPPQPRARPPPHRAALRAVWSLRAWSRRGRSLVWASPAGLWLRVASAPQSPAGSCPGPARPASGTALGNGARSPVVGADRSEVLTAAPCLDCVCVCARRCECTCVRVQV